MRAFVAFMFTLFVSFSAIAADEPVPTAFATQAQANIDGGFIAQRTLCGRIDGIVQRGTWRRDRVWEEITRNLVTAPQSEARNRVLTDLRNRTSTQTASDGDLPGRVYEAMSRDLRGACQHALRKDVDLYFMVDVQKNVTDPALQARFDDFLKK